MEHDDRPPVATFVSDGPITAGGTIVLGEAAAHHARVKRLDAGDVVRITDGAGTIGIGTIEAIRRGALDVSIARTTTIAAPSPIHLRVPIGDRDRMLWLAEKATELGITTWQAVRFRRSMSVSPRGEGPQFADKVRARMISALEQSGGAWLPAILPDVAPDALTFGAREFPLLLDVNGAPLRPSGDAARAPIVLFGPEGGLEPTELDALVASGWQRARIAATTLRFETAGIAAVAVLRASALQPSENISHSGDRTNG